ncbi:MAG TPA: asparagine synthase (glutamine-hydrolyzing) [Bryobacteraceae bacterium]
MCGIAGMFRAQGSISSQDAEAVRHATELQKHRGPDDDGFFSDAHAALGHRRLAIIDLSPAGRQPMANEDKTIWVVFNGEIYNFKDLHRELQSHRFSSCSDTEVIIHGYEEWGIDGLLKRLHGMFAFALYQKGTANRSPRFILARDSFGIKPLYYYARPDGGLAFASELKALHGAALCSREPDLDAISGFLLLGSVPSPLTAIRDVRCLMPGEYIQADCRNISVCQYSGIDEPQKTEDILPAEDKLRSALGNSIARHLVSDVPVGVFLSGGVDSAALVSMASRLHTRLSTVTVVFDESEFSEARPARMVAERFRTNHTEVRITSADFLASIPAMLSAMDQPTNDGLNTFVVSRAARGAGLKVILSGLGADEIFWGYSHYRRLMRHGASIRRLASAPRVVRNGLIHAAVTFGKWRGRESWMRLDALRGGITNENLYLSMRGFYAPSQVGRLLGFGKAQLNAAMDRHRLALRPQTASGRPSTNGFNAIELRRYMHDQLLRDTDVFSMSQSIEVRVPFLDRTVAAAALAIPPNSKLDPSTNKPNLVRAVNDDLVSAAARRRKAGFSFPLDRWMKRHASQLREMALQSPWIDRKEASRLWTSFEANRLHWSRAWALVVLGGWN